MEERGDIQEYEVGGRVRKVWEEGSKWPPAATV